MARFPGETGSDGYELHIKQRTDESSWARKPAVSFLSLMPLVLRGWIQRQLCHISHCLGWWVGCTHSAVTHPHLVQLQLTNFHSLMCVFQAYLIAGACGSGNLLHWVATFAIKVIQHYGWRPQDTASDMGIQFADLKMFWFTHLSTPRSN